MHDPLCIEYNAGFCVCDLIKRVRGSDHDPFCNATYKHLIPVSQCRSCANIRMVRADGIKKWQEDVDTAYWQGYNNAMIEKSDDV